MDPQTVQLMVTCLVDRMVPHVGRATVDVLGKAGCQVEVPDGLTCCGQPAYNVGMRAEAIEMAARTVEILNATAGPIVLPSGSCTSMIVAHYPELLSGTDHEDAASAVASRTRELSQFLVEDLGLLAFDSVCEGCQIAVHRSCHGLRTLEIGDNVEQLMEPIAGAETVELDGAEECCGFGGLFSIEMSDVSAAILDTKLERIERSGADTVVAGDVSCLMHIEGGLRRRNSDVSIRHFVELLGGQDAT